MKKIWLIPLMALLLGCDEKPNQEIINKIWIKTLEVTQIAPDTPIPEILFLEKDFHNEFLKNNYSLFGGRKKTACENDLKEINKQLTIATGKNSEELYGKYFEYERKIMNENCESYNGNAKEQCEQDKKNILSGANALGKTFFFDNRIEIYPQKINRTVWTWDDYYKKNYNPFSYSQNQAFFYGIVAHEMIHIALFKKGIPANNQHKEMRDKEYLGKLLEFISETLKTSKDGACKDLHMKSLEKGIEIDEITKKAEERTGI